MKGELNQWNVLKVIGDYSEAELWSGKRIIWIG